MSTRINRGVEIETSIRLYTREREEEGSRLFRESSGVH
jgi:hypothetical protein